MLSDTYRIHRILISRTIQRCDSNTYDKIGINRLTAKPLWRVDPPVTIWRIGYTRLHSFLSLPILRFLPVPFASGRSLLPCRRRLFFNPRGASDPVWPGGGDGCPILARLLMKPVEDFPDADAVIDDIRNNRALFGYFNVVKKATGSSLRAAPVISRLLTCHW